MSWARCPVCGTLCENINGRYVCTVCKVVKNSALRQELEQDPLGMSQEMVDDICSGMKPGDFIDKYW